MIKQKTEPFCFDCDKNWMEFEYYMVHNPIWIQSGVPKEAHLCLACLENRLDRKLKIEDFTDAPVNWWVENFFVIKV